MVRLVVGSSPDPSPEPSAVHYNRDTDTFTGTMVLMVKLAMRAVQEIGWKLDQANEKLGLVTFQTGMSFGSWSGISGFLNIEEVSRHTFRVTGTGKQNLSGGQLIALNIGGEAQSKARKAISKMIELAIPAVTQQQQTTPGRADCAHEWDFKTSSTGVSVQVCRHCGAHADRLPVA